MAPKKPSATAEVALVPLKNCLVNLPPSLTALLVNANAVCFLLFQFILWGACLCYWGQLTGILDSAKRHR